MTPEELDAVVATVSARVKPEVLSELRFERTKAVQQAIPQRITRAQAMKVVSAGLLEDAQPEEAGTDRRLGATEEGRIQRICLAGVAIGAALVGWLTYIGADPSQGYALMFAAASSLFGNAILGGIRQQAKAKVEVARVEAAAKVEAVREGGA